MVLVDMCSATCVVPGNVAILLPEGPTPLPRKNLVECVAYQV